MEYRAPSSLATADAVLRRRSGASYFDEQGDLHRPTVLLVRRAPSSPPLPALPPFSSRSPSPPLSPGQVHTNEPEQSLTRRADSQTSFSSVSTASTAPLPTPDLTQRADLRTSFSFTSVSTVSTASALPTPVFIQPPPFLSLIPRGRLSFFPPSIRPLFSRASTSDSHFTGAKSSWFRPQSVRSDSQGSSSSSTGGSDSGSNSIDSGHRALIKSIGTTDKFTDKWPRPQSLRAWSMEIDAMTDPSPGLLEDGRGAGERYR
ncbi:hypothetical protein MVEN_00433300 [Mycena venus]|uniref:Uncharacterized protein n=1 Tax=Mycena venus TaxID=2733690 RepID=A0A8H6YVS5_9AGAR|nr:hypothetical protein MVEN_00433300 [Mycena venus]